MTDTAAQDAAPVLPLSRTLAIVKPDAVAAGKAEEILHLAELAGFTVIQQQRLQVGVGRLGRSNAQLCRQHPDMVLACPGVQLASPTIPCGSVLACVWCLHIQLH
jgi:hypothetical protein